MVKQKDPFDNIHCSRKEIFFNNFIGGIAWGLGATVGVSLLITLLTYLASRADVVPIIGDFVSNIISFVLQNNEYLQK